ncbi:MAG: major facilitator superfamily 1 [Acidimicrobiaceae bacterium]|nr:major facilitator superfamily 1 [Acidimicrobiaceae bacterium]
MLTPASTDAVNRAARLSYEEATGITQTVRNYSASLGFAIPGTTLVSELRSRITASLIAQGASRPSATAEASKISQTQGASGSAGVASIPYFIRLDFAYASRTVFDAMAAMIAVGAVVDFLGLEQGLQRAPDENLELASAEVHR